MKKIAKILSVLLSLAVILSCVVTGASAAGETYLKISGEGKDGFVVVTDCLTTARGEIDIPSTWEVPYDYNVEPYEYVTVPVTQISTNAFSDCTKITKVNIPSSVTRIGNMAFNNCDMLEEVTFAGDSCTFGTNVFYNCRLLKTISLPANTKQVTQRMFYGCSSLESFDVPSSVTTIGSEAFGKCSALTAMTIPSATVSIGKNAFIGCNSITAYTVESGNTVYSSSGGVLYGPDPVTSEKALIQYPNGKTQSSYSVLSGTKVIADYAFGDNTVLTKIVLPNGLETVDSYAFYNTKKLSDITIPSTVKYIGSQAFGRCSALKSITIPANVETFESAFYMSAIESVVIANGVESIGTKAFENCTSLTSVTIPASLKTIGIGAFYGCTALKEMSVPSTVTAIENGAFKECSNLTLWVDSGSAAHTYAINNSIPFKINGVDNKTVKSVSVLTRPNKTSYIYKESLDTTGLKLSVTYTDGSTETVTSGYEVSPKVMTKTGSQVIDVTYEGCTAQFSVNVSYAWWQWIIMILLLGIFWY